MRADPVDTPGLLDNPFHVLELSPGCTPMEIERAGNKLLAMLGVNMEAAATYRGPLGPRPRDADLVRRSMDALRDPDRRVVAEFWAAVPLGEADEDVDPMFAPWPEALEALGWVRPEGR
ncbi:MAG: hypothetical protein KC621_23730 [Myxococcales bacterium]|nr:hypothetical protein [Myxococcales bacterium]